jgi:tetratricopeptide (TPR) repeat protein
MRKLLLTGLLAASVSSLFAQKLEDVQEKISKNKYDEAKEKIDKFLADPKNQTNANAWYYKGKVYAELAREDTTGKLTYDAGREAFDAFKRYQELDKKNIMMTLDQNIGLFQLYDLYYNDGIKSYNQKDYPRAYDRMKRAMELEEYIAARNYSYNSFSFPVLDTQLVNLTASSAYLAKREDEAIPYFEKLANARLKDKDYREVYSLVADYYLKKGDQAKADKYLGMGRELFPDNDYWIGLEFGDPGKDTLKRFTRYEQMIQKYPDNYSLSMDYAIEWFNYTYSYDKKPADYTMRQDKTEKALEQVLKVNPNSPMANYVMTKHLSNQIYDLEDMQRAIKGNTPADVAKRKDLTTKLNQKYDQMYTYAQKAFDLYTAQGKDIKSNDKLSMRQMAEALADYYDRKKDTVNADLYRAKMKNF